MKRKNKYKEEKEGRKVCRPIVRTENIVKENLRQLMKMEIQFEKDEELRQSMKDVNIKEFYKNAEFKPDQN